MERKQGRERKGERHAANGQGWNRTRGCCSKDESSVYGVPAQRTELPDTPEINCFNVKIYLVIVP